MTMLAGIDISTRRLDLAVIPIDVDVAQTVTFRTIPLAGTLDDGERYRQLRIATGDLVRGLDIQTAWIERPRGPFRNDPLTATYGAVMASIPLNIARASLDPQDWRRLLGLPPKLTKPAAIDAAVDWLADNVTGTYGEPDEHRAEALLISLAGRALTWRHHEASTA